MLRWQGALVSELAAREDRRRIVEHDGSVVVALVEPPTCPSSSGAAGRGRRRRLLPNLLLDPNDAVLFLADFPIVHRNRSLNGGSTDEHEPA
jgi:hypothetical protein